MRIFADQIKLLMILGCVILVSGCMKFGFNRFDENVVSSNQWLALTYLSDRVVYYAPYQTVYNDDSTLSTVIFGLKKSNNQKLAPIKIDVNCEGKLYRGSRLDSAGNWRLEEDWTYSPKAAVISNLCFNRTENGRVLRFINIVENPKMPNKYYVMAWEPHDNYANNVNKFKVYKYYIRELPNGRWLYSYFIPNCNNGSYATASDPESKSLNWIFDIKNDSTFGFLMNNACGFNWQSRTTNNQANSSVKSQKGKSNLEVLPPKRVTVVFESKPSGASVKDIRTDRNLGVTPFALNFELDPAKLTSGSCTMLDGLVAEWVSGAKFKTKNPFKICMNSSDRFLVSINRPNAPGLQADIDYQIKLEQLKIQQESLAAQQRQASALEDQARAQRAQAEAEEAQAKSAQDALLLQMFQGGSMIKKSPSRMPINCSPDLFGNYSCY